jgi:hypothetical protein
MSTSIAGLPVGSVSVSGSDLTVSQLLNSPRIIERRLAEAAQLEYWADRILPNVGAPGGGVLVYEEWSPDFMLPDRKAEELAPDAEVPLAGAVVGDVKTARAKVDGLGYTVDREQENRNQRWVIDRKERAVANGIAIKGNGRAVALIKAVIVAASRTFAGFDWSAIVTDGATPTPKASWPHSQLALIQAQARSARIPFQYDGMLAHPSDVWRLSTIYQLDGTNSLATKLGLREIISDNTGDVERGKPILYSSGNTGGTAWEEPVKAETIPEPRRRRKVVQLTGSAAYFIDNPYGLLQFTGVAAADLA